MDKTIANKLIALRKQNGLSQADLAAKLGTDLPTVAGWESADISPDTENLLKIARLYNISLDKLFELNSDPVNQRSSISLDKNAGEIYPNAASQNTVNQNASAGAPQAQYAEAQDMSSYFKYETVDENAGLPAAQNAGTPSAQNVDGSISALSDVIEKIGKDEKFYKNLMKFPYPVAAAGAFLIGGGLFGLWHPLWMLFLTIPLYYTTIEAIRKKNANIFCYPVFVTLMYLISGFMFDLWHPGWLTFLTIPFYYWIVNAYGIGKSDDDGDENGKKKKKRRKK
jgi:transcriptional regulator with XRE-family HTH domain